MNVLVTGAAGLVGSNFCEYLLENRKQLGINIVYGVDDFSGGYVESLPLFDTHFVFLKVDLTDKKQQETVEDVFKTSKIDYIWHFSAYAAEGLSPFIRQYNYISNVIPTAFLINMGIKYSIKRFVFTSSMATYGNNDVPFTEDMQPNPIDPYGIAKYACEMDLKSAYNQHGLEYCIILPHNIYGKYQNIWDPYRNVLGIWIYKALRGEPFTIYGDGEQTRAFSYIDDILPCLWKAGVSEKAKNERINLGGKKHTSLNEASKILLEVTATSDIEYLEPRHEVKHAWSSYEKSEILLDYKESVSLKQGLTLMWEWAKSVPERERVFWKEYELEKDLYSYWKVNK
jgi:UDP-glucose 4-epimerase